MKILFTNFLLSLMGLILVVSSCFSLEIFSTVNIETNEIDDFVESYRATLVEKNYEKLFELYDGSNPEFRKQETEKWKALFKQVDLNSLKIESVLIENNKQEAEIILSHKTDIPLMNLIIAHYINEVYKITKVGGKWLLSDYVVFKELYDTVERNLKVKVFPETNELKISAELLLQNKPENEGKYFFKLDEDFQIDEVSSEDYSIEFKKLGYVLFLRRINDPENNYFHFKIDYSGTINEKNNQYIKEGFCIIRDENFWYPKRDWEDYAKGILEVTVPQGFQAISDTGKLNRTILNKGIVTFIWEMEKPAEFIGFLASRNWEINHVEVKNQEVSLYLMRDTRLDVDKLVAKAEEILVFYNESFGPTKERNFAFVEGPFSHTRPNYTPFDESILAHELSHNWWLSAFSSDSMKNLWLSEGFATYSDILYKEWKYGKKALEEMLYRNLTAYLNAVEEQRDQPLVDIMYGSIVYNKGAYVLHSLRRVVGDEAFFKILKYYTRKYFDQDVSYKSFKHAAEEVYDQDLSWFFDQWLKKTGIPEIELKYQIMPDKAGKSDVEFKIIQKRNLYTMPIDIQFVSKTESNQRRYWITNKDEVVTIEEKLNYVPDKVCFVFESDVPATGIFEFYNAFNQGVQLLYKDKKYPEAIEKFKDALQIRPDDLVAKRELAMAYLENEDDLNFEKVVSSLINKKYEEYEYDQRRWAYLYYGNYYDLKSMREKALEMYKRVLEIEKGDSHPQKMAQQYIKTPYKKRINQ